MEHYWEAQEIPKLFSSGSRHLFQVVMCTMRTSAILSNLGKAEYPKWTALSEMSESQAEHLCVLSSGYTNPKARIVVLTVRHYNQMAEFSSQLLGVRNVELDLLQCDVTLVSSGAKKLQTRSFFLAEGSAPGQLYKLILIRDRVHLIGTVNTDRLNETTPSLQKSRLLSEYVSNPPLGNTEALPTYPLTPSKGDSLVRQTPIHERDLRDSVVAQLGMNDAEHSERLQYYLNTLSGGSEPYPLDTLFDFDPPTPTPAAAKEPGDPENYVYDGALNHTSPAAPKFSVEDIENLSILEPSLRQEVPYTADDSEPNWDTLSPITSVVENAPSQRTHSPSESILPAGVTAHSLPFSPQSHEGSSLLPPVSQRHAGSSALSQDNRKTLMVQRHNVSSQYLQNNVSSIRLPMKRSSSSPFTPNRVSSSDFTFDESLVLESSELKPPEPNLTKRGARSIEKVDRKPSKMARVGAHEPLSPAEVKTSDSPVPRDEPTESPQPSSPAPNSKRVVTSNVRRSVRLTGLPAVPAQELVH